MTQTPQRDERVKKLERVLREAHLAREDVSLGSRWARFTMQDIRDLTAQETAGYAGFRLDQLVWKTATMAAAAVLVLTVSMVALFSMAPNDSELLLSEESELVTLWSE